MTALDIVVVTYGSRDLIGQVAADARPLLHGGQLVVVDNGRDGTADRAEALGARVLRRPDNPGFGAGQNAGVAVTTTPFVLLLNPDARPDPRGVEAGLRHLAAHPEVAAVQGTIVNEATEQPERSQGIGLGPLHLLGRALGLRRVAHLEPVQALARRTQVADYVDREVDAPREVDSLAATALLVRRSAFDDVGGFDEGFFLYGEDVDLCRRLRWHGWRLVALPERGAVHLSGGSSESSYARELEWWRGTMRYAARWYGPVGWAAAVVAALLRWVGLAARRPHRARRAWRAVVGEPLRVRPRIRRSRACAAGRPSPTRSCPGRP